MNNPKLSVIIPVYKVEKYLERCVKSVLSQDYGNLEIILIDDGSPDKCPALCDELASQDNRIVVIHKQNGGSSSARNAGLEKATGEYVAFLDSDDQWKDGMLMKIMNELENLDSDLLDSDLVIFPHLQLREDTGVVKSIKDPIFGNGICKLPADELYKRLTDIGDIHESAWSKLIKRDFLLSNNLQFKQGITGEDYEWMHRLLRYVDNAIVIPHPLRIYTTGRLGSVSNTPKTKSILDLITIIESSIDYYTVNPDGRFKNYELANCAYLWSIALGLLNKIPRQDRGQIKEKLISIKKYLVFKEQPRAKKAYLLYKFLGFDITARLLSLYITMKKGI